MTIDVTKALQEVFSLNEVSGDAKRNSKELQDIYDEINELHFKKKKLRVQKNRESELDEIEKNISDLETESEKLKIKYKIK